MPAGAAAGTALLTALNSKKTVKATTNLKSFVDGINDAQKDGALDNLNEIFGNITRSGPILGVFKYIFAIIQAGTMDSTMKLFQNLMDAIKSEEGKAGMDKVIGFINIIINGFSDIIDRVQESPNVLAAINGVITILEKLTEMSLDTLEGLIRFLDALLGVKRNDLAGDGYLDPSEEEESNFWYQLIALFSEGGFNPTGGNQW